MTDSQRPDTSNREDERAAVVAGTHSHWSSYDPGLEGARWHALQGLVSKAPFDDVAAEALAEELVALGHGYGYGQADSFMSDFPRKPDPLYDDAAESDDYDAEENARLALFDAYHESEYFENTFASEDRITTASVTGEAKAFSRGLANRIDKAFLTGRDLCVSEFVAPEPADDVTAVPSL